MSSPADRHPKKLTPAEVEAEYASDYWDAARLGLPARRGRSKINFAGISQPWLRAGVKEWCRWRLATGITWNSAASFVSCLGRFSAYLAAVDPGAPDGSVITRALLERYVSWCASGGLAVATRASSLIFLRGFLEHNRRHAWCPEIPEEAALYQDDLPHRDKSLPRYLSEFVMGQLEDPAALALLEPTVRHLVIVLMETGLRSGDATCLEFNPVVTDSSGWPCLRYWNSKGHMQRIVPLSEKAAMAIADQQAHVSSTWPGGCEWLFPDPTQYSEGPQPISYHTVFRHLRAWQERIGLHDEMGLPITVSPHQFRHTVGTRLINAGVPQHIVQAILGHASPGMTDVYAKLHDSTVRMVFERYQAQRVDIAGAVLAFDADSPAADAEWIKHNLARVSASLPNGYCGRPPQQECPHPNACLTCPAFQTTVEFLPVHRQHAKANATLIAQAERQGQERMADNHRRIQEALERIIPALEALQADAPDA